ncbi:MAG TPA: hypothetical protein VGO11_27360 [Chthoniobacteraceae bacterium]|jgi:hypothetical protein|nr:hypothetical protein [Chthoniobacteraceae bacterium]
MNTKTRLRPLLFAGALLSLAFATFGADQPSATPNPLKVKVPGYVVAGKTGTAERKLFDETYQFLFFATLEGLYRDGVSSADVDALLARKGADGGYLNFIYTCPICMPVEGAIETYKLRPRIDHMKVENHQTEERTFGFGLPKETSDALRSEKASVRLGAVNELVSQWVAYRMDHSGFTDDQKKALIEKLKKGREEGMKALQGFAKDANGPGSLKNFAPGYEGGDECAICNAALQMPLKLK